MSKLIPLTLDSLQELEIDDESHSTVRLAFQEYLAELVKDCIARPAEKAARTLNLKFTLKPKMSKDGTCDEVRVHPQFSSKCPSRDVKEYTMLATHQGGLKFNVASPDDPDQKTMDFD